MQNLKLVLILILVILLAIMTVQNTQPIQTKIIFITIEMPLILLLLLTAATGFALGILVALLRKIKNKSQ